jgi:hypothetical protein
MEMMHLSKHNQLMKTVEICTKLYDNETESPRYHELSNKHVTQFGQLTRQQFDY